MLNSLESSSFLKAEFAQQNILTFHKDTLLFCRNKQAANNISKLIEKNFLKNLK